MLGIGNGSSRLGIGNVEVQNQFVPWNRKWRSSSLVRSLESEMEDFEQSSTPYNRKWGSSRPVPMLGIGNGRVRAKFKAWNRK